MRVNRYLIVSLGKVSPVNCGNFYKLVLCMLFL